MAGNPCIGRVAYGGEGREPYAVIAWLVQWQDVALPRLKYGFDSRAAHYDRTWRSVRNGDATDLGHHLVHRL